MSALPEIAGQAWLEREIQAVYPSLLGLLQRTIGRPEIAQELCQDAVLRLIERQDQVLEPRAWLFRTATHLAWDWLRHQRVEREHSARNPITELSVADSSVAASAAESIQRLRVALRQLPEQPRRVFELSRFSQLSQLEISARLGIARKTVENHLTRALALLAKALGDSHGSRH